MGNSKLMDMRQITRLTGVLEELQVKNLQFWGSIAFPHADKFGLSWDGVARTMEYDLTRKSGTPDPEHMDRRFDAINTSVKDMLGDEWLVTVKEQGKVLYTGARRDIVRVDPEDPTKLIKKPFEAKTSSLAPPYVKPHD